ncbi:MAG: DUF5618 family protein [Bacteroidota bacterium]
MNIKLLCKQKKKILTQKTYDEATRLMNNAHKELQLAKKNGKFYYDIKHLQVACGTAYLATIKAINGIFLLRNIPKPKRHASIEYYQHGLNQVDKKILASLNVAYRILHIDGYYEGFNHAQTILTGFKEAQCIINKLKQSL